jgi:hypothetical protein
MRIVEVDDAGEGALFVVHLRIPEYEMDGRSHQAKVRFVRAVSRVVPRGTGEQLKPAETSLVAEAAAEFTAARSRAPGGVPRASG